MSLYESNLEHKFIDVINKLLSSNIPQKIAIAVSGGVDSMALLHLAANWLDVTNKRGLIELHILHVNHNIRPESQEEEIFVKSISLAKNYKYHCIYWNGGEIKSAMQEKARQMRYEQMSKYCLEHGIPVLFTAHHKNDTIENYVFRKKRGAGKLGLSSSYQMYHNDIRVVKPLCRFYKAKLIAYMKRKNYKWYEDPSNNDSKYSRNAIRLELAEFSRDQMSQLEEEIEENDRYCKIMEDKFVQALAETTKISGSGAGWINLAKMQKLDADIQVPLLSHVLTIISGARQIPRYRNLETILELINSNRKIDHTIHSCRLIERNGNIFILKEKSKINPLSMTLSNGLVWDDRFQFFINGIDGIDLKEYNVCAMDNLTASNLKKYNLYRGKVDDFEQKRLLFTLPIIKKLEKVVAVPHIFYYDDDNLRDNLQVVFKPKFISRFTHFQNNSGLQYNE